MSKIRFAETPELSGINKEHKINIRGRGALENPAGRFELLETTAIHDDLPPEDNGGTSCQIATEVYRDASQSIISTNDSEDVYIEASVNPYRGCEHGCIYCYARPTHEFFGLSAGLDFETKIFAKPDAPALLRAKLGSKAWQPKTITMSGVTDPYQPLERRMGITRGCLEVLAAFRNPVVIVTKNALVTRDIDLLKELAAHQAALVLISVTTLDSALARAMEPRASTPKLRLRAIEMLAKANIPVGVMIGPVLPALNEHEIPAILESAAMAGARNAAYTMLRLPYGVKDLFQTWLHTHYPNRAERILSHIRAIRGGKLNDSRRNLDEGEAMTGLAVARAKKGYSPRMRGEGVYAEQIAAVFRHARRRYGLDNPFPQLSAEAFRRDAFSAQMNLF